MLSIGYVSIHWTVQIHFSNRYPLDGDYHVDSATQLLNNWELSSVLEWRAINFFTTYDETDTLSCILQP